MNYNSLECAFRNAVVNTLGKGAPNFAERVYTGDGDIGLDSYTDGVSTIHTDAIIEMTFDPDVAPFDFFSGDVCMCATFTSDECALHVYFGDACSDEKRANVCADRLDELSANSNFIWRVEDEIEKDNALHLCSDFKIPVGIDSSEEHNLQYVQFMLSMLLMGLIEEPLQSALKDLVCYFDN